MGEVAAKGADGLKFFGYRPDIMQAAIEEAKRRGLRSACHHAQMDVARVNVLTSARWGLTSMEHWYGLPEALFTDRTVQSYPLDYNYADEVEIPLRRGGDGCGGRRRRPAPSAFGTR